MAAPSAASKCNMKTLPPWEANEYFQLPTLVQVTTPANATTKLCLANPMRVGLILSAAFGANTESFVGPVSSVAQNVGVRLNQQTSFLTLTHQEWGPLVQMDWFGFTSGTGGSISVIEVVLNDWPQDDPHAHWDVSDKLDQIMQTVKLLAGRVNGANDRAIYIAQKS